MGNNIDQPYSTSGKLSHPGNCFAARYHLRGKLWVPKTRFFSDVYEETVAANQAESLGLLLQRSLKENARLMKILQEERRVEQERQLENCQTAAAQGRKSSRRHRPAVKVLYLAMRNSCTY